MKCNEVHSHSRLPIAYTWTWTWRSRLTSLTHTDIRHTRVSHSGTVQHLFMRDALLHFSSPVLAFESLLLLGVRLLIFYYFERAFYSHCQLGVGVIFNQLVFCPKYFRYVLCRPSCTMTTLSNANSTHFPYDLFQPIFWYNLDRNGSRLNL